MAYKNKRGVVTVMLFFFVFFALFVVVIAGTAFYGLETFNDVANLTDFTVGNISFSETYQDGLGQGLSTIISTLSTISFALLIGMIIVMMIVGFRQQNQNRTWIVVDIGIIIVAFIAAVYISIMFNSFINSNDVFLDVYSISLQRSSAFLLNLPFIVAITGGLVILITYIPFKKKTPNVLEFN